MYFYNFWKLTLWRLCYFKVCIMWIGHIILTHSNPFRVKSSWRTDALLMLCQTCAFYLVTRQPCCFISIAEPAGNALLNFVGDMTSSGWNVWKHTLSLSFIRAVCLDCVFLVVLTLPADLKQWQKVMSLSFLLPQTPTQMCLKWFYSQ